MRTCLLAVMPLFFLPAIVPAQADMYDGRPAFAEGVELGYYVWKDGDKWHLRWTTKGAMRAFTGSVESVGGKLSSLKRIDVESESRVLYPGRAPHTWVGPRGRVRVGPGRAPVVATRDQDHVEMDGKNRILFNARTNNDIDGFDFKVDDEATQLTMVLRIDGQPRPMLVEAGKSNQKPGVSPIVIQLR